MRLFSATLLALASPFAAAVTWHGTNVTLQLQRTTAPGGSPASTLEIFWACDLYGTVGGGGGMYISLTYRVEATVAPADAIVLTGGGYRVAGGFWADVAPPVPDLPVLTVLRAGNLIAISWSPATPGFALETTEDLAAPAWTPVPNAISQGTTLTLGPRTGFFRLVRR